MGIIILKNCSHQKHHGDKIRFQYINCYIFVIVVAFKFKMKKAISILLFIGAIILIIGLENALVKACGDCCDLEKINENCDPKCQDNSCIDEMHCINPVGETCWPGEE